MLEKYILILCLMIMTVSCNIKETSADNPFFTEFNTPYGVPPFDIIKLEHYLPAFEESMKQHTIEINAIINNTEKPTLENTIISLEQSGEMLDRVSNVFYAVKGANTNPETDSIAKVIQPKLAEHSDNINLNTDLFKRIESVKKNDYEGRSKEDRQLIDKYYKNFIRSGIALDKAKQTRMREINKEMGMHILSFNNNVLKETSAYQLVIDNEKDLAGLPSDIIAAAAQTATERGHQGKWIFTLDKPSWEPFLQYADNRDLRKEIYTAFYMRANNDNDFDNKENIKRIVSLRLERANLLGYKSHAEYVLDETMAKTPENVNKLLSDLWKYAIPKAKEESSDLLAMAKKEGHKIDQIESWDWWYYAEKLRKEKYELDEEAIKEYLVADNVREGIFAVANKLYGINFNKIDVPVYHKDVEAFKVTEADGKLIGIIYFDSYTRPGVKNQGAWMGSFRKESIKDGNRIYPIIYNVGNYNPPSDGKPALLNLDQVKTMFHEFGHALHGLLSQCNYTTLSGTAVARDFVELPSQLMEHWAFQPEVMKIYGKHYHTGETIPDELIAKINNARTFNQGFKLTEMVSAAMLDMEYHTLTSVDKVRGKTDFDIIEFEKGVLQKAGLIDAILPKHRSTYFRHIFSESYSSGFYSYLWSEVLDADAFQSFIEKGLFNQETAKSFRDNILSKGGSEEPMILYKRFKGAEPNPEHMLRNRGLVN
ncbi:M3 family metallopeptidase [Prevotella sp. 10(H)]|uniref:M3 family metallopeptidase n=1 Tax=Prevotella sp. 10(H) TaxID=1158294 RepID=UPI0012DE20BF|nr:M3 family metallopeptidase [Prevotella sp. 10(H)]